MPRAILEFQLPEERDEHTLALHGVAYYCALVKFQNALFGLRKHRDMSRDQTTMLDTIDLLWDEALGGVNLEEVD